ncbi:MAG: hypothetical protein ACYC48_00690 [Minisyncoccota bacterium]
MPMPMPLPTGVRKLMQQIRRIEGFGEFVGGIPELFGRAYRMCHQGATEEELAEVLAAYERGKERLESGLEPDKDFIPPSVVLLLDTLEEVNCRRSRNLALQQGGLAHGSSPLLVA